MRRIAILAATIGLSGCAHLYVYDAPHANALPFRESIPYLMVTRGPDCSVSKAELISLPGKERAIAFDPGIAGGQLQMQLKDGALVSVGQSSESDTAPILSAAGGLIAAAGPLAAAKMAMPQKPRCAAGVAILPLKDGVPDAAHPLKLK